MCAQSIELAVVAGDERNALVDQSSAVAYLAESRSTLVDAFKEVCQNGPLASEPLRDVQISITDARFHGDSVHRSASQVGPAARRSPAIGPPR